MNLKQLMYVFASILILVSIYFSRDIILLKSNISSLQKDNQKLQELESQDKATSYNLNRKLHILQNNLVEMGSDTLENTFASFQLTGIRIPSIENNPPSVKPHQYTYKNYLATMYNFDIDAPKTSDSDNILNAGEAIGMHGVIFPDGYAVQILKFEGGSVYIPQTIGQSDDLEAIPVTLFAKDYSFTSRHGLRIYDYSTGYRFLVENRQTSEKILVTITYHGDKFSPKKNVYLQALINSIDFK